MNTPDDIFTLPPITLEKIPLSVILNALRNRINKSYMPSAYGNVQYNSKPRYLGEKNEQYPHLPNILFSDCSGYYNLTHYLFGSSDYPICFNLSVGDFQIVVNLSNDEAIVRHKALGNQFIPWPDDKEKTIPLYMEEVREQIDIYG